MAVNIIQKLAVNVKRAEKVIEAAKQLKKNKDKTNEIIKNTNTKKS